MTNSSIEIQYIGVDVSKHTLEVAFDSSKKTICYDNSLSGVEKLLTKIQKLSQPFIIIEPTGGYENLLEQSCYEAEISIASVLANRVRDFARANGQLAKNDRIDAQMILRYGQTFKPDVKDQSMRKNVEFKALTKRREQLVKLIAQEKNHLESTFNPKVKARVKALIKVLEAELKEIEQDLSDFIDSDAELREKSEYLKSIKGVGDVLTLQSLSGLPELGAVSNKEIAALVGLAPYVKESGQYRGQAKIYGGRSDIRNVLYMACLAATRCNPSIKQFYTHLRGKGKPFKVAMVACMRKLIIMMNCVCKEKRLWQENYAS